MRAKRRRKRQFLAGPGGGPCMSAITLAAWHRKAEGWRGKAPRPGQVRASRCCAGPRLRQGKSCHQVPCKTDRGLAPNFKEEALWEGQGTRFDRKSFPRKAGSLLRECVRWAQGTGRCTGDCIGWGREAYDNRRIG